MAKVEYKSALKMQIFYGALCVGLVVFSLWLLQPFDTVLKLVLLSLVSVLALFAACTVIPKLADIRCPHCKEQIWGSLHLAASKVKFCPFCGGDIEV